MKKTLASKSHVAVSYAEYGSEGGFPILVNHGLIASIDDFELFDRLLKLGVRLVCLARPGYGESEPYEMQSIGEWADLVSTVIDTLHLTQFDVLGMSSGAPYTYALGWRFPDQVRNIYIFSGIPALYEEEILSHWPYPVTKDASIREMEALAREIFFRDLSAQDLQRNDIQDSMKNNCFGIALDLKLRGRDWGFRLQDVKSRVFMQHSREDEAVPFTTAWLTSQRLPNCHLDIREHGEHFSPNALDDFIATIIAGNFEP